MRLEIGGVGTTGTAAAARTAAATTGGVVNDAGIVNARRRTADVMRDHRLVREQLAGGACAGATTGGAAAPA